MKNDILAALNKNPLTPYELEGITVYLRQFTGHDRKWLSAQAKSGTLTDIQVVVRGVVDEAGRPIFNDKDAATLGEANGKTLAALAMAILNLNAADVETSEKN